MSTTSVVLQPQMVIMKESFVLTHKLPPRLLPTLLLAGEVFKVSLSQG